MADKEYKEMSLLEAMGEELYETQEMVYNLVKEIETVNNHRNSLIQKFKHLSQMVYALDLTPEERDILQINQQSGKILLRKGLEVTIDQVTSSLVTLKHKLNFLINTKNVTR